MYIYTYPYQKQTKLMFHESHIDYKNYGCIKYEVFKWIMQYTIKNVSYILMNNHTELNFNFIEVK